MKTSLSFFLAFISFFGLSSFAQDNPLFRHIPPNAGSVYQVNIPAITSKLNWQDFIGKLPSNMSPKSGHMMEMMKNPLETGINITKDFIVAETEKGNADSLTYTTVIFHLADSARFVAFLTKQEPGIRYFSYPKGRAAGKEQFGVAWDKDIAVVTIVNAGDGKMHDPASKGTASGPKRMGSNHAAFAARKSFLSLKGFDGSVYTTNTVFKEGFADDADIHMWAPQGSGLSKLTKGLMHKDLSKDPALSRAMGAQKIKYNTLTALRFETGRITIKGLTFYPPDSLGFYGKLTGRPLNTDLITRLPKGKLLGMVSIHITPSAIGDMLDHFKMRGKADSSLAKKNLSVDDISKAFKGDLLFACIDPDNKPVDSSAAAKQPGIFLVTTINDLSSFMKLADNTRLLKDTTMPDGNGGTIPRPSLVSMVKGSYTLQDNILVISLSKGATESYFSNTEKRNTDFLPEQLKESPFGLYIDIKTVLAFLQAVGKTPSSSEKDKKVFDALGKLESFTLTGGAIRDGKVETYMELKMGDPSENSLRSLIKMIQ